MKLYRIQTKVGGGSLWYHSDGTKNDVTTKLTSRRLESLPMDFDPRYREDGRVWQCAAWSIDHFNHWFTLQDFNELVAMDFEAIQFDSSEFIKEENQVLYTRSSMRNVEVVTDVLRSKLN